MDEMEERFSLEEINRDLEPMLSGEQVNVAEGLENVAKKYREQAAKQNRATRKTTWFIAARA